MRCNGCGMVTAWNGSPSSRRAARYFDFAFDARLERDRLQRCEPRWILRLHRDVQGPARLHVARTEHRPERAHRRIRIGHDDADLREQCNQRVARLHREFERHRNVFVGVVVRHNQAIDGKPRLGDDGFRRDQLRVIRARRFGHDRTGALRRVESDEQHRHQCGEADVAFEALVRAVRRRELVADRPPLSETCPRAEGGKAWPRCDRVHRGQVLLSMPIPIDASSQPPSHERHRCPGGKYSHASGNGVGDCLQVVEGMRWHCAIGPYKSIPGDHRGRGMHGATRKGGWAASTRKCPCLFSNTVPGKARTRRDHIRCARTETLTDSMNAVSRSNSPNVA